MRIQEYEAGRIVVDGREENDDVILIDDEVHPGWGREDGQELRIADLGTVVDAQPDILVVGTGRTGDLRPQPGLEEAHPRHHDVGDAHHPGGAAVQRPARQRPSRRRGVPPDVTGVDPT